MLSPNANFSALKTLTPFLQDEAIMPPSLRSHVEQAMDECDAQLAPVPFERLKQIVARLMLHFGCKDAANYTSLLQHYPEDLLCAAYLHVVKHAGRSVPPASDLIAFMQPEMRYRKTVRRRLMELLEDVDA